MSGTTIDNFSSVFNNKFEKININVRQIDPEMDPAPLIRKIAETIEQNVSRIPDCCMNTHIADDITSPASATSPVQAASGIPRHHLLSRILKGLLGTTKVMLGLATAILTGGSVLGAVGGTLMIMSGANDLICALTGKTLGEHFQDHWPESIRARRAGVTIDIILKLAGVCGGAIQGLTTTLEMIFHISLMTPWRIMGGVALSGMDEMSKLIDGCSSRRHGQTADTPLSQMQESPGMFTERLLLIDEVNDYCHVRIQKDTDLPLQQKNTAIPWYGLRV